MNITISVWSALNAEQSAFIADLSMLFTASFTTIDAAVAERMLTIAFKGNQWVVERVNGVVTLYKSGTKILSTY